MRRRAPVVLPEEELERRALLLKDWQRYKFFQWAEEERKTRKLLVLRKEALDELRTESEELYQQAIQVHADQMFMLIFLWPVCLHAKLAVYSLYP